MRAPDPAGSRAIFIGVHSAADDLGLGSLPAVKRNLDTMRQLFTDGTVWALPESNCASILEPTYPHEVLTEVERVASEATDTLLLYYAGHGLLVGKTQELHLALRDVKWPDQCLSYAHLRARLRPGQRGWARRTVVILDCCYSGEALNGEMGAEPAVSQKELEALVASKAEIEGVCVLTASAATRKALSPIGDEYSAFTAELIHVLRHGVHGGAEYLNMTAIYDAVADRLAQRTGMPVPQFGARGHGAEIVLAMNRAHRTPGVPDLSAGASLADAAFGASLPDRGLPPVLATYKGVEIRDRTVLWDFLHHLKHEEGESDG